MDPNANGAASTTAPAASAPVATPAVPDVAERLTQFERQTIEMQRQLQVVLEENKALKDESAARRIAAREAEMKAAEASAKAGDVDAMKRAYDARIAEMQAERERLASLEPKARAWEQYEQTEAQRVTESAKVLPPAFAKLFADAASLDAKRNVLAAYEAVKAERMSAPPPAVVEQPKQAAPLAPPAGAPAGTPAPQVSLETASVEQLEQLRRQDPSAFARLLTRGKDVAAHAFAPWSGTLKPGS